jgi:molybdopterin converting factor small subunit
VAEIVVRYFASARAASGVPEERVSARDIDDALAQISALHGTRLAAILEASSLLLDGVHVGDHGVSLPGTCTLDVLPPFAGG